MKTEYSDNISVINSLTQLLSSDTIDDSYRTEMCKMRKLYLEKFIAEVHHNKISSYEKRGHTYYCTRVKSIGKVHANSMDELFEKLYETYTGKKRKDQILTFADCFDEAVDWWCSEQGVVDRTRTRYRQQYEKYIKGNDIDLMLIKDITTHDINAFINTFRNKVTRKQIYAIKSYINMTFAYAADRGLIPYNIAYGIKVPKSFKALPEKEIGDKSFSHEECAQLLQLLISSTDPYDESICFNAFLGLRYCELAALKWSDFNEDRHIVTISHAMTQLEGDSKRRSYNNIKTGDRGARQIVLGKEAMALYRRYKAERPDSEWVFPNNNGNTPITNKQLCMHLKSACKAIGIPYRANHSIRASVINSIADYADIESAGANAGQTNLKTTQRYRSRLITPKQYDIAENAFNYGISTIFDQFSDIEKTS